MTDAAFERFMTLLHPERDRAGEAYEELRRTLIRFFRWRGGRVPEDLADETLQRVAAKSSGPDPITHVQGFTLGVARLVLLEEYKNRQRELDALVEWKREAEQVEPHYSDLDDGDDRMRCLQQCLRSLSDDERVLVLSYYRDAETSKSESRRALAVKSGLTVNALRIRAHRLRERLENCIEGCIAELMK